VIVESATGKPIDLALPVVRERAYGDTMVRVHTASGR
jgi:hypothetical protein